MHPAVIFQIPDFYLLRPRLLRVRVNNKSCADHKPNGSRVESGPRVPWFDVCLQRCKMGQIKQELTKIQSIRLPRYVTPHYITLINFLYIISIYAQIYKINSANTFAVRGLFGSQRPRQISVYIIHTEDKQLRTCTVTAVT